jgi:rhodanese-related sulfurtransferase
MIGKALVSAIALGLLTSAAGHASELVDATPASVPGATTVDAQQAKDLFDNEAAFVDLRKENVWNAGRIPGAIWLDFKNNYNQASLEAEVGKDEAVVFYCSGVRCPRSAKAATSALAWGYQDVYYFRGGYPEWKNAGLPVE